MNFQDISLFGSLTVLFAVSAISACTKADQYTGMWQGQPERIEVNASDYATATVSIDFAPVDAKTHRGNVNISAVIEVEQAAQGTEGADLVYEAGIAATASASGHYITEEDDADDIFISLDSASYEVDVDPAGVTFSQNVLTGMQQPELDSLTAVTAERWRALIAPAIHRLFSRYNKIDDIEVHHRSVMTFEIGKTDYVFNRVGVPD